MQEVSLESTMPSKSQTAEKKKKERRMTVYVLESSLGPANKKRKASTPEYVALARAHDFFSKKRCIRGAATITCILCSYGRMDECDRGNVLTVGSSSTLRKRSSPTLMPEKKWPHTAKARLCIHCDCEKPKLGQTFTCALRHYTLAAPESISIIIIVL